MNGRRNGEDDVIFFSSFPQTCMHSLTPASHPPTHSLYTPVGRIMWSFSAACRLLFINKRRVLGARSILNTLTNSGLISADRRAKPTLMLTIPCSETKSSARSVTRRCLKLCLWYGAGPKGLSWRRCAPGKERNIATFPAWILT